MTSTVNKYLCALEFSLWAVPPRLQELPAPSNQKQMLSGLWGVGGGGAEYRGFTGIIIATYLIAVSWYSGYSNQEAGSPIGFCVALNKSHLFSGFPIYDVVIPLPRPLVTHCRA